MDGVEVSKGTTFGTWAWVITWVMSGTGMISSESETFSLAALTESESFSLAASTLV